MAVTQYVGARYVPVFADPLEWSNTREYEPLTIVLHNSNSYTSRQAVPTGINISNETYWALTGNFNAQIMQMQTQVNKNTQDIADLKEGETDSWNLILGDSWGDTTRSDAFSQWAKDLISYFPNTKSFCVSGATVSQFSAQVTAASNDSLFSNSEVRKIIVVGGVNDFNRGNAINSTVDSFLASVKSTFVNADITFLCNCPNPTCSVDDSYRHTIDEFYGWFENNFDNAVNLANFLPSNRYFTFTDTGYSYASYHLSTTGNAKMFNIGKAIILGTSLLSLPIDNLRTDNTKLWLGRITYDSSLKVGKLSNPTGYLTAASLSSENLPNVAYYVPVSGRYDNVTNGHMELILLIKKTDVNSYNGFYGPAHVLSGSTLADAATLPLGINKVDINLYSAKVQNTLGDNNFQIEIEGTTYVILYYITMTSAIDSTTINLVRGPFVTMDTVNVY